MIKKLLLPLLFILLASTALAVTSIDDFDLTQSAVLQSQLNPMKAMYNQNIEHVPGFIKTTFGNTRADIHVDVFGGEVIIGTTTADGYITQIKVGGIGSPDMHVYTDIVTVSQIMDGQLDILDAFNQKKITYQAVGFKNKVKFGIASIGLKIGSFFL